MNTPQRDPLFFLGGDYELVFGEDEAITLDDWTLGDIKKFQLGTGLQTESEVLDFLNYCHESDNCTWSGDLLILKPTWEALDAFKEVA